MIRRVIIAMVLSALAWSAEARQAADRDFTITRWSGGTFGADLRIGLNLTGPATGAGTFGGMVSTGLPLGGGGVYSNPASLGRLTAGVFSIESRLPFASGSLGIGPENLVSDASLRRNTDSMLSDFGFSGTAVYTRLNGVRAGQPGQVPSFSLAYPVTDGWAFAGAYQRTIDASLDLSMSGLEVQFDAARSDGSQAISIAMLAQVSAVGRFAVRMDALSLGTGFRIASGEAGTFAGGLAVHRFEGEATMNWRVAPDVMAVIGGTQQYFFNDPADPNLDASKGQVNTLFWKAVSSYRGGGWGGLGGLEYRSLHGRFGLSVVGSTRSTISMYDEHAVAESWLPTFVSLAGEADPAPGEEGLLDVERLSLARPNLTRQTLDSLGTTLTLRTPSSLTFGLDLGVGAQRISANYILYSGELSVAGAFAGRGRGGRPYRIGKRLADGFRVGIDLRFPDRLSGASWLLVPIRLLFLDIDGLILQAMGPSVGYRDPHYRIAVGWVHGDAVSQVERNIRNDVADALDGTLPTMLSIGRSYSLGDRIDVGVTLIGIPDLGLRVGLAYRLP